MAQDNNRKPNQADIQNYLGGVHYPADKDQLKEYARSQGADDNVISSIDRLPDKEYTSPVDISQEYGDNSSW